MTTNNYEKSTWEKKKPPYLRQNDIQQFLRHHIGFGDERTHHVQHEILDFDAVRIGDDGEDELVQMAEDLLVVLQVQADVERLHPRQVLQQIKVTVEERRLGVF